MDLLRSLKRGARAGAASGLLVGAFGYLLAEPLMDRAVRLETARDAAEHRDAAASDAAAHHAEVFSRSTQHLGLFVAAIATGIALGVLVSVVHAAVHRRGEADPWRSALRLAAAGFFAVYLVPFVRYPANPPGVGDPDTVDARTNAYLAALAVGLLGVAFAWRLAGDLRARGWSEPARQLAVTGVLVATLALPFLLPANTDALDVPAGLLWEFRLLALASGALLWAGLGVFFGLLARPRRVPDSPAQPETALTGV